MYEFVTGAIFMGSLVTGLFFIRFYQKVRDRFFLFFASAFMLFALERFFIVLENLKNERAPLFYLIRVIGFLIIIAGIIDKNRRDSTE